VESPLVGGSPGGEHATDRLDEANSWITRYPEVISMLTPPVDEEWHSRKLASRAQRWRFNSPIILLFRPATTYSTGGHASAPDALES
jgi:hypothetical protein